MTKATVTLVFDNTDKLQSPVGYDQYDEITVTRQVCLEHMETKTTVCLVETTVCLVEGTWHEKYVPVFRCWLQ